MAAVAILFMGVGMIVCGAVTDRLSRHGRHPASGRRRSSTRSCRWSASASGSRCTRAARSCSCSAVGIFFAAGISGPAGAMVANLTRESIRSTAFGTLTLANNLLGLAAGPLVVGMLADKLSPGPGIAHFVPLAAGSGR